jgi:Dna[CI] antecedent DciA-like protein
MLKLSEAIGGWAPSDRDLPNDPLTLLQAGWSEIVGAEVAANSAPWRIAGATLTIVTRSAAWSHQLSFLGESVTSAVSARLPNAGIERLRFRVGALPKRGAARARQAARAGPQRHVEPARASATADEALAHFARRVSASQRAKRSAGWKDCQACGVLVDRSEGALCAACGSARREERALATARLLFEAPWLGFSGTSALINGLCEEEYERIRSRLLKRWWGILEQTKAAGRLSRDGRERLVASSYVVLRSRLSPETIAPATVRNVLGDELHDLLYGDERNG